VTTLTLALVALATVPESRRATLADVRTYALGSDLLVWSAMVWYHDWSTGKMMTGDRSRSGRYSWTFWSDPDSAETTTFDELVDCEPGTRGRIYSALKVADMLAETRRTGDVTTADGVRILAHSFGLRTGDECVRVSGPLARRFAVDGDRGVKTVTRWIDEILHPVDDDDDETDETGETETETLTGHDLGAVASPTYESIIDRLSSALVDSRLLAADELVTMTEHERASMDAVLGEWSEHGDTI
jgi:hypothetical protein